MATTWCVRSRRAVCEILALSVLLFAVANAQVGQDQSDKVTGPGNEDKLADAIREVKGGNWAYVVQIVIEARAARAIPILQELFVSSQDVETKEEIADDLFRLGDRKEVYWDFLLTQAMLAVESPSPMAVDAQGNVVRGQISQEFLAWAKAHDVPDDPVYLLPGRIARLAMTGDRRAIPVLRKAMLSSNVFIRGVAAKGLAHFQDKDSIPLLIEACGRTPEEAAVIAMALIYFDDPRAQSAAEAYLPKDMLNAYREQKNLSESGPFGIDCVKSYAAGLRCGPG